MEPYKISDPFPKISLESPKKTSDGRYFFPIVDTRFHVAPEFRLIKIVSECPVDVEGMFRRRLELFPTDEFIPNRTLVETADQSVLRCVLEGRETMFPDATFTEQQILARVVRSLHPGMTCRILPSTIITGHQGNQYDANEMNSIDWTKAHVDAIVRLAGVWFTQRKFGVSWDLVRCSVRDGAPLIKLPYQFEEEDEQEWTDQDILDHFPDLDA